VPKRSWTPRPLRLVPLERSDDLLFFIILVYFFWIPRVANSFFGVFGKSFWRLFFYFYFFIFYFIVLITLLFYMGKNFYIFFILAMVYDRNDDEARHAKEKKKKFLLLLPSLLHLHPPLSPYSYLNLHFHELAFLFPSL